MARPRALAQGLAETDRFERRRALKALLRRPLLTADGPEAESFVLVRRHTPWLREWLGRHPDWRLEVDSEMARLRKLPADLDDATRPARDPRSGTAFSRRRYVLFCLALAALERGERQTTLGHLAESVFQLASGDPTFEEAGLPLDLETRDQRRDLVQVVRLLLDLGILVQQHGDEQQYVDGRGDVLYSVRKAVLAAVLNARRPPSTIEAEDFEARLGQLVEEPVPDTADGRRRRIRSRITRSLLDDPVLYHSTLDDDETTYLRSQWSAITGSIGEATGLVPEVRREGLAMVDERGDATDLGLPEEGTYGHLTLLLAEFLAAHARSRGGEPIGLAALEQRVTELIAEHGRHWAKKVREAGAASGLLHRTLRRLEALRLVRRVDDGVVPLPAIGRFALDSAGSEKE